jgi:hypothetical protein
VSSSLSQSYPLTVRKLLSRKYSRMKPRTESGDDYQFRQDQTSEVFSCLNELQKPHRGSNGERRSSFGERCTTSWMVRTGGLEATSIQSKCSNHSCGHVFESKSIARGSFSHCYLPQFIVCNNRSCGHVFESKSIARGSFSHSYLPQFIVVAFLAS